jgi:hypothetical protein
MTSELVYQFMTDLPFPRSLREARYLVRHIDARRLLPARHAPQIDAPGLGSIRGRSATGLAHSVCPAGSDRILEMRSPSCF